MRLNAYNRAAAYAAFYGMRARSGRRFRGYGALPNCPGDDWFNWCMQSKFAADPAMLEKCLKGACGKGYEVGFQHPKTVSGQLVRGLNPDWTKLVTQDIPQIVTQVLPSGGNTTPVNPSTQTVQDQFIAQQQASETIFGIPKKAAMIGGGILAVGVVAALMSKK